MNQEKKENKKSQDILEIARSRFALAESASADIRAIALEDLKFRAGEQWPTEILNQRKIDHRPVLTINKIPQYVRQITNDQRQNRPSIKVHPVDDKADIETAKIYQGLIRHIQYNSSADTAFDSAFEGAVTKGFGYFRIITDYVSPYSFEQELLIKRVPNDFSVYLDPFSTEPDGSDANWGFIFEDISKDDYKAQYKDSELSSMMDWRSLGDSSQGWIGENSCRIAEYFYKDYRDAILVKLNTGEVFEKNKLPDELPQDIYIVQERKTVIPIVKWVKLNGIETFEETEFPSTYIPIIPVYGDMLNVDGKIILEGIVRNAKDPQRMTNFWATAETEAIALAPKAPYVVAEGQIPPQYAHQWKTANIKNHAFLVYKPTDLNGQLVAPPQRNSYEPAVGAITNARLQASEDLKATTGIYDASMGARSNEVSGAAIRGRLAQAQTNNFHFIDNLTRSLRHAGRVLVQAIPIVYDTKRAVVILGEDGTQEIIHINEIFNRKGKDVHYNLSAGKYDVTVETGPSYATKRQEALSSMVDLTRSYPRVAEVAADLMVKNMDWPGATEIAERIKKTLPPNILENENKQVELPQQVQVQMQQMNQLIDDLTTKLNEQNEIIRTKSIEIESKERIEFKKLEIELIKKQMDIEGTAANAVFKAELQSINERLKLLDINNEFDEEQNKQDQFEYFNTGAGLDQAALQNNQQQINPTGGFTPGISMGEM